MQVKPFFQIIVIKYYELKIKLNWKRETKIEIEKKIYIEHVRKKMLINLELLLNLSLIGLNP